MRVPLLILDARVAASAASTAAPASLHNEAVRFLFPLVAGFCASIVGAQPLKPPVADHHRHLFRPVIAQIVPGLNFRKAAAEVSQAAFPKIEAWHRPWEAPGGLDDRGR